MKVGFEHWEDVVNPAPPAVSTGYETWDDMVDPAPESLTDTDPEQCAQDVFQRSIRENQEEKRAMSNTKLDYNPDFIDTAVPEVCGACSKPLDPTNAIQGFTKTRYHPECVRPEVLSALASRTASTTPERIRLACFKIADMLVAKNKSYGDSALKPTGIFAKGRAVDLINARIDDKLNRIKNAPDSFGDNDLLDLIGYLIILMLAREDEAREAKP